MWKIEEVFYRSEQIATSSCFTFIKEMRGEIELHFEKYSWLYIGIFNVQGHLRSEKSGLILYEYVPVALCKQHEIRWQ